jgi:hypothetical protein
MTYTYALLGVSRQTYDEIHRLLEQAGYHQLFNDQEIDMHGIGLVIEEPDESYPRSIGE